MSISLARIQSDGRRLFFEGTPMLKLRITLGPTHVVDVPLNVRSETAAAILTEMLVPEILSAVRTVDGLPKLGLHLRLDIFVEGSALEIDIAKDDTSHHLAGLCVLRAVKNRHAKADVRRVLRMTERGLV